MTRPDQIPKAPPARGARRREVRRRQVRVGAERKLGGAGFGGRTGSLPSRYYPDSGTV